LKVQLHKRDPALEVVAGKARGKVSHRYRVGILGATGAVGQKLVTLLSGHPWFEVRRLAASVRSAGRRYRDAVRWLEASPIPRWAADLTVEEVAPRNGVDLVLSALDAATAREAEPAFIAAGIPVLSNASAFRMENHVPLLVPEVNPHHLAILERRPAERGILVTNPNCSSTGLVLGLKPLADAFPLRTVLVTTLQAVSGGGYPGVPSLDALGNVLPLIPGEEEKLQAEPRKILGEVREGGIEPAPLTVSAQANRVPVLEGHLLSVSVGFAHPVSPAEVREAIQSFRSPLAGLGLPSAPDHPLVLLEAADAPQPRLHSGLGGGMTVSVGRVCRCPVLDVRFVVLVHNTVRGAAGGAVLNGELLAARGFLSRSA